MAAIFVATLATRAPHYTVTIDVAPDPLLASAPPLDNSDWAQVFNPTWVQPTRATDNQSGLLVRSQNCTYTDDGCPYCAGPGQKASWLTWVPLDGDTAGGQPKVRSRVDADAAVFGPFDCESDPDCADIWGAEDPRLTYDPETELYYLLYNANGGRSGGGWKVSLRVATTADPRRRDGWTRYPALIDNAKSGSVVWRPAGPHYLIWGCARTLQVAPSIGRSLLRWDFNRTKPLLSTRAASWDSQFVESAMPPLELSTGDLLFFYDSLGVWNATGEKGFQPGWAVLSGSDPTQVIQRAETPPMPWRLPWERGDPPWRCNVPLVTNLGGGHALGADRFRLYFGGADAATGTAVATVVVS